MKEFERIRFPLFPTNDQKAILLRNCHNARFAYNWGVAKVYDAINHNQKLPSTYALAKEFNEFKHKPGNEWLIEKPLSQRAIKCALIKQLDNAISKFMREHRRPPAFKTKKRSGSKMSYYAHEDNTKFKPGMVQLEGIGYVKCRHNILDNFNGKITEPIVMFNGDRFELSVSIKYNAPIKPNYHYSNVNIHSQPIGIDVGVCHMAVTSNGDIFDLPKEKLSKLDKRISSIDRKIDKWGNKYRDSYYESLSCDMKTKYPEVKDVKSQNLLKLESKRRKLYHKHDMIRENFRCQTINSIVKQYPEAIIIEDIGNPKSKWMIKGANRYNKRINDASIGDFLRRIKNKCEFLDIPLIIADSNYPSTKMCSCCGNTVANTLTRDRMFICSECGYTEDRDLNAAYNLRNLASTNIGKKKKKSKKIA